MYCRRVKELSVKTFNAQVLHFLRYVSVCETHCKNTERFTFLTVCECNRTSILKIWKMSIF